MSNSLLELIPLKGSPRAVGLQYGDKFAELMNGFCVQEAKPTPNRILYAKKCWKFIEKFTPLTCDILKGVAKASKLGQDAATLLVLHEEIFHQEHCTAIAATGTATKGGQTFVGQNWDWHPNMYPWAGLLKMKIHGRPEILSYHYPGLISACGINDAGLSLMWTGGGYLRPVLPKVGVPTYALINEILSLRSVKEALRFIEQVPNAGSFMFFLGDATGQIAMVEGIPGYKEVVSPKDFVFRANLFGCKSMISKSRQVTDKRKLSKLQSTKRVNAMCKLNQSAFGKITASKIKEMLLDERVYVNLKFSSVTIDSLVACTNSRTLSVRRGGHRSRGSWQEFSI